MSITRDDALGAIEHGDHTAFDQVNANAEAMGNQVTPSGNPTLYTTEGANATLDQYADFAGFDANNRQKFDSAVDTYIQGANDILDGFNSKEETIKGAFKGSIVESLNTFFNSIKNACQSYVKAITEEKAKVLEAEENWLRATQSISGDINEDADAIQPVVLNN